MKNIKLLSILLTLFIAPLTFLSCQINTNQCIAEKKIILLKTEEKIKLINERVEKTNKDSAITVRRFLNKDSTLVNRNRGYVDYGPNGKVACFIKNDTIVRISYWGEPSFGSGFTNEYYFRNKELVFVSEWSAVSFDGETVSSMDKYYFDNQKLIKTYMSNDNTPKDENTLLAETKELVDLFKEN